MEVSGGRLVHLRRGGFAGVGGTDVEPRGALLALNGSGQPFLTAGVPIAPDALVASAGIEVQIAPLTAMGVTYTGQVAERAQDHAFKGVFSYRW